MQRYQEYKANLVREAAWRLPQTDTIPQRDSIRYVSVANVSLLGQQYFRCDFFAIPAKHQCHFVTRLKHP